MRPAQRYDDFKLIRITCQAACHGKTEHGIFVKFKKPAKLLSSYLLVSPSRVLRAPGTSPYHLVPKHLRTTYSRPEQSHLLPEACSPNGTDKRRQRQRQTERPPPESGLKGLYMKMKFLYGLVTPFFCARRSVMMILNLSESLAKPLVMAKLNMAYLSSLKNQQNCCRPTCWCHHLGYSVPPALHRTIWCRSTFGPRGPGLSNPTSFLRPALPMAPTRDDNARDKRSVFRPNRGWKGYTRKWNFYIAL